MDISSLSKFNLYNRTSEAWLEYRRNTDGAEGLWRIHNSLYDVKDFIHKHPGGRFWLETTKGTDVTALFESHHIKSERPQQLLEQFYVRKAATPNTSSYTFKEDGFYKTLKREVQQLLKTIPEKARIKRFQAFIDALMVLTFIVAVLANYLWSYLMAFTAGVLAALTITAAHNYLHQRDNFRMYYPDIFGISSREFRIIHVLSHHMQPNTTADIQIYFTKPFVNPLPEEKSFVIKYLSWFYGPFIFFPLTFHIATLIRFYSLMTLSKERTIDTTYYLLPLLPLTMYMAGGQPLVATLGLWQIIIISTSFCFSLNAFTNAHVHPDIYMEGDATRSDKQLDWGIHQIETVCERYEINASDFLVLVSFGEHALHHLFPTLDHGILHYLNPIALKTMQEFNLKVKVTTQTDMTLGYFKRLALENKSTYPQS